MSRYEHGKIYKICNSVDDAIYVGSTCEPQLSRRMAKHRSSAKLPMNASRLIYKHINRLGLDKFYIELIELYPCNSKDELLAREGHWIRTLRSSLNMLVAGRTHEQYRQETQYDRQHYQDNRQAISERRGQRFTCECGGRYTNRHKAVHHKTDLHQSFAYTNSCDGLNLIDI